MHVLIALVVGVFAGGFGGYQYGAKVQKAVAAKIAAGASAVAKKV